MEEPLEEQHPPLEDRKRPSESLPGPHPTQQIRESCEGRLELYLMDVLAAQEASEAVPRGTAGIELSHAGGGLSDTLPHMVRKLTFLVIFLVAFGVITARIVRTGGLNRPPAGGDERDYEALAFNIWKGRGFGFYWSDPEWQAPYLRAPATRRAVEGRASSYYPTTYRPPAFPTLWALTHAVMGRNFGAIRILNAALMAGAVALAALVALEFAGIPAAVLTMVALLLSPDVTLLRARAAGRGIGDVLRLAAHVDLGLEE